VRHTEGVTMTRGKAATQSANRRLAEAQEKIAELERRASEREAESRAQIIELRAELGRAQGALNRQVRELSEARVVEERERANVFIRETVDKHFAQVAAGMDYLGSRSEFEMKMSSEEWVVLADKFGVDIGPLMAILMADEYEAAGMSRRELMRTTNGQARYKERLLQGKTGGKSGDRWDRWRETP
jgi:hypothetical protein